MFYSFHLFLHWLLISTFRDFLVPFMFKFKWEKIGSWKIHFTDGSFDEYLVFEECSVTKARRVILHPTLRTLNLFYASAFFIMMYETGYKNLDQINEFMMDMKK